MPSESTSRRPLPPWPSRIGQVLAVVLLATVVTLPLRDRIELSEIVMVYLLGIVLVALRTGRGGAAIAAALSVALFDFLFVPPYLTFAVSDTRHVMTFVMLLVVGLVIGTLTSRAKEQAVASGIRERRTAALLGLSRELTSARELAEIASAAARHVRDLFESNAVVLLPDDADLLVPCAGAGTLAAFDRDEQETARWVYEHGSPAGFGTARAPERLALYVPLRTSARVFGVLGVLADEERRILDPEPRRLLEALCDLAALALERVWVARDAERSALRARTEELRNTLLSSVSHDLRTPLAAIKGAATALLYGADLDPEARRELLVTTQEEADRLERLVSNLLDMTRLESGGLRVRKEWVPLEEVVGSALRRVERRLGGRAVETKIAEDALVALDDVLMENVLVNLLENAIRHTPPSTPVSIAVELTATEAILEVADRGPGIPAGSEERVFEKFWQAPTTARTPVGVGLGLPICRGIVEAHGGKISASPRAGGGTVFRIVLPVEGLPPAVPAERREES